MTVPHASSAPDLNASIIAIRQGRIGHILLNRPKALNALDLPMIAAITDALMQWRDDPGVHAKVLAGPRDRPFSALPDLPPSRSHALPPAPSPVAPLLPH